MASYVKCLLFFSFVLSLTLQIHARDIKFFSKVTKTTKENHDSISLSPTISPSLAPSSAPALSPESEAVEHGYGLYGRDPYENTAKNTVKPTEKPVFDEEKYVPAEELSKESTSENFETTYSNNNGNGNGNGKVGMSDTRFLENGKYYYNVNQDGNKDVISRNNNNVEKEGISETRNGNEREKQGMSDTKFLENGKYYYDVHQDGDKVVDNYVENKDNINENGNGNGKMEDVNLHEKQGMSDTRYLENGKYFYDTLYDTQNENSVDVDENENNQFEEDNHGSSQTPYLDNGKYFYGENNIGNEEHNNFYHNKNNYGNGHGNGYGSPKKFANEYDTMEEYDREQGFVDPNKYGYTP